MEKVYWVQRTVTFLYNSVHRHPAQGAEALMLRMGLQVHWVPFSSFFVTNLNFYVSFIISIFPCKRVSKFDLAVAGPGPSAGKRAFS